MTRALCRVRRELRSLAEGARTRAFAARLLLLALATLLAIMPWTERVVQWDRFFRGGQDVEFGLLAIGVAFGLALLLAPRCRLLPPLLSAGEDLGRDALREGVSRRIAGQPEWSKARSPHTPLRI